MLPFTLNSNTKEMFLLLCYLSPEILDKIFLGNVVNVSIKRNLRIIYSIVIFAIVIAINANYLWMFGYWLAALSGMPKDIIDSIGKTKYYSLFTLCVIGLFWLCCTPYALNTPF